MERFEYIRAVDAGGAVTALAKPGAQALGGGTNLVDLMRLTVLQPAALVDVTRVPLAQIAVGPSGLTIGAMVRNSDLADHADVKQRWPVLSEAILNGASPQIRNLATVGGNLLQRTRCAYFRDVGVTACNKRSPGSGCAAMDGWTRMHAILGTSDQCIAAHPSDMAVALLALDATVRVRGQDGERTIAMVDFHKPPGGTPNVETALRPGDFIVDVTVPDRPYAARSRYVKARDRASYAFALASCAACVTLDGDTIKEARVALGGVATTPWLSAEAAAALVGKKAHATTFREAASAALAPAKPRRGNAFKVELAKRVIERALVLATTSQAPSPSTSPAPAPSTSPAPSSAPATENRHG